MAWPTNSIIEGRLYYRVNDQVNINVLHWIPVGNSVGFTLDELMDAFHTSQGGVGNGTWIGEMKSCTSQNTTFFRRDTQLIWPTRYRTRTQELNEQGAVGSPAEAQNVAATLTKRGALGKRSNIGSYHVGGVPSTEYQGGILKPAQIDRYESLITNYLDEFQTDNLTTVEYDPVILNKVKNPITEKYEIIGATQVQQWLVQDTLRTMRRRTLRVGI